MLVWNDHEPFKDDMKKLFGQLKWFKWALQVSTIKADLLSLYEQLIGTCQRFLNEQPKFGMVLNKTMAWENISFKITKTLELGFISPSYNKKCLNKKL